MSEHEWAKIGVSAANVSIWECTQCGTQEWNVYGRLPLKGCKATELSPPFEGDGQLAAALGRLTGDLEAALREFQTRS